MEIGCVYVCGCTGSGKSAAAVQIALRNHGEIINADALQLYKGLDIATAKINQTEMCGVPHHLFNVFEPHEKANVRIFSEMAIKCVEDLHSRSVLPIVVGGTHYYVEALLFERSCDEKDTCPDPLNKATDLSELDPYLQLKQIDPLIASTIHPNDSRRIQKALTNEMTRFDGSETTRVRFSNSIVVIVNCDLEILKTRLRNRVDQMIQSGLLNEVLDFFSQNSPTIGLDLGLGLGLEGQDSSEETHELSGINIAIGYKELLPYVLEVERQKKQLLHSGERVIEGGEETGEQLETLLNACVERIKISTIQYARRQRTWVNNSLLQKCHRNCIPVIILDLFNPPSDSSAPSPNNLTAHSIEELCSMIAHICERGGVSRGLRSRESQGKTETSDDIGSSETHLWKKRKIFTCDLCGNQSFQGHDQFQVHLRSKRHRKHSSAIRKKLTKEGEVSMKERERQQQQQQELEDEEERAREPLAEEDQREEERKEEK